MSDGKKILQGFEDSRRLTGPNLYLPDAGAALETLGGNPSNDAVITDWQMHVMRLCEQLAWPLPQIVVRKHKTGASLAFSAPIDQLYTATEINEWAWLKTCALEQTTYSPGSPSLSDDASAFASLEKMAAAEKSPELIALIEIAEKRNLPVYFDDEFFSIGEGQGCQTWSIDNLPEASSIHWHELSRIPTALITGSNGKTTTTRLVAAMCREHGWHTGHNCTDGLFFDGVCYEEGDYSGPMGARAILRNENVEAGILETARGGILRRGLAVKTTNVAAVTNVSPDHFGEYGIHDLSALADVKLTVARALASDGVLVLNADDSLLMQKAHQFNCRHAYFSMQENNLHIADLKKSGGTVCELLDEHLYLNAHDLGAVEHMPLSVNGTAKYNIENLAAAACIAFSLGVKIESIKNVLHRFGNHNSDNPGRLQRWQIDGVNLLIDYAHNPEGLAGFLSIAKNLQGAGRLALLLGQAGNREDNDIRELAKTAAQFKPDFIMLKDIDGYIRGRAAGEVAAILRTALIENGIQSESISTELDEVDAVRKIIAWTKHGDMLALPIHSANGRAEVEALMQRLTDTNWRVGDDLPARNFGASESVSQ
jgi:cyanophycin synthetase